MRHVVISILGAALMILQIPAALSEDAAQNHMVKPEEAKPFEFASPQEALATLRARPGVEIRYQDGWTLADDRANFTLWSFTPANHPAHPAGVKRILVKETNGNISVVMSAKCGATKTACDKLMEEFRTLNDRMRENVQKGSGK